MKFGEILKPASSAVDAKKQKRGKNKECERKGGREERGEIERGREEKREGRGKRGVIESPHLRKIPLRPPPPFFFLEIPLNDINHLRPIVDNL